MSGRGRPEGRTMKRHNVAIDDETIATLRELGDGNVSLGIRKAAAAYAAPKVSRADVRSIKRQIAGDIEKRLEEFSRALKL